MATPISLPVIDMSPLFSDNVRARQAVAARIGRACEEVGFFYVCGHRLDPALFAKVDAAARRFFALPKRKKAEV
ncbi:2-oxoglutarate and iron-dependent oxygenase domain-containing protein, partial [Pseudomonas sp. FW306-2-11AC]|uniref:2-oxoglutarate and iron-dependent oxygenase domain-containing protein n=1 Tax=Pseudomonas sp. FW306-2-11AC TaxID=2070656 RepID=UPI000CBED00F